MNKYQPTIGLEIHAELKTHSKMFCNSKNDPSNSEPNTNVCPICLGMPGTLPVINKQAVEWTILTGLALNCEIAKITKWDRKNYFYPDLPKGYQISQYDQPIATSGWLKLKTKTSPLNADPRIAENLKRIHITRIHLEEDTGTLKHPEGREGIDYSLIDYNRAGVPLMELVTEPDIESAEQAKEFCQKYQTILRYLGVSDAEMEKGQMRCEANISLRSISNISAKRGSANSGKTQKLGTKVEIKNLNSFKAVARSIEYEIKRQSEILESGKKVIQETRGWDDVRGITYSMRVKETSADYRYFPEPDLPPIAISHKNKEVRNKLGNIIDLEKIKRQLPELPEQKKKRYIEKYKLTEDAAEIIANNLDMILYYEKIVKLGSDPILTAKWVINELSPDFSAKPQDIFALLKLIGTNEISNKIAKDILPDIKAGKSPLEIIRNRGIKQISSQDEIKKIVQKVMGENPEIVAKIRSGKTQVIGFLIGQIMKETGGQVNPQIAQKFINEEINQ